MQQRPLISIMRHPDNVWPSPLSLALSKRPDLGALMCLCEKNYTLLLRLAPALRQASGQLVSRQSGGIDLHLEIEEQARYTTQIRLTHLFHAPGAADLPEPNARLRAYHDAVQVEVLDLCQSALPLHRRYRHPALAEKWQANLFLAKWLTFCLYQGHCFHASGQVSESALQPADAVAPIAVKPKHFNA